MNKNRKFITFVESIVDDPTLLNIIKTGHRACMESVSQEGDEWLFILDEPFDYENELAIKYFDIKTQIHNYKKETGVDVVTPEDITLTGSFSVNFDEDYTPHSAATTENPAEGGLEIDGNIVYLSLELSIDGNERDTIEIEDPEQLAKLDPMLLSVIESKIDDHRDDIAEKIENQDRLNAEEDAAEREADRW